MAEQWEWDEYGLITKVGDQYERVVWIELVDNVGTFERRPCLKAQLKALPALLAALEELLDNLGTVAGCECDQCSATQAAQAAIAKGAA